MNENTKNLVKKLERSVFAGSRITAAEELGKIGDSDALPALIEALEDSNPRVRVAVAEALGNINVNEAVSGLNKSS